MIAERYYAKGNKDGVERIFNQKGNLMSEIYYKDGVKEK